MFARVSYDSIELDAGKHWLLAWITFADCRKLDHICWLDGFRDCPASFANQFPHGLFASDIFVSACHGLGMD